MFRETGRLFCFGNISIKDIYVVKFSDCCGDCEQIHYLLGDKVGTKEIVFKVEWLISQTFTLVSE